MKVALVHDYLYTYGGAERVLEALKEIWPSAPVFTAWADWSWLKRAGFLSPDDGEIIVSWFDQLPFKKRLCSPLRFLTPLIWQQFYRQLEGFEVVISSSAWYMAKGVSLAKLRAKDPVRQPIHICYCHTPPRYLYGYPTALNFKKYWWGRLYAGIINPFMRFYDYRSSQTVDYFVSNSREVGRRITKFYRRQSEVVYPPVFVSPGKNSQLRKRISGGYFLMVNRLVRHKNVDLAIKAAQQLKLRLKIAGDGPERKRLAKLAAGNPRIEILGYVDDHQLSQLYQNCRAVFYLAEQEDFGITPVEAAGFGKPVIALRSGGVEESLIAGKTGLFIEKLELEQLIRAVKKLAVLKIKPEDCFKQAEKFSKAGFKKEMKQLVKKAFSASAR